MISDTEAAAAAYLDWWRLAGVDCAYSDALPAARESAPAAARPFAAPARGAPVALPPAGAAADRPCDWPDTLEALQAALARPCDLPGGRLARVAVPPEGLVDAPVMLVSDCPSTEDCKAGRLFAGAEGRLLGAMLRAMGIAETAAYRASLAACRPASGTIDAADFAGCAALMRHHVALARPRRLILFGAATARALLDCELREARGRLHILNHDRPSMVAVVTHHPRTMLGHPGCKREAWADLKLLLGEMPS